MYQMAHLYIMARSDAPGVLKIGRSKDPASRAKQLEASQCFRVTVAAVFEGAGDLEPEVHSKLAACRHLGGPGTEWFTVSRAAALRAVVDAMDAIASPQPPASSSSSSSFSSSSSSMDVDASGSGGRVVSAQHGVSAQHVVSSQHASMMRKALEEGVTHKGHHPLRPALALMYLEKLSKRAAQLSSPYHQQEEMARLVALTERWHTRSAGMPQEPAEEPEDPPARKV